MHFDVGGQPLLKTITYNELCSFFLTDFFFLMMIYIEGGCV